MSSAVSTIVAGAGIGQDETLETPRRAQRLAQQVWAGTRVDAVDLVVGAHHRGCVCLGHGGFERRKVDFVERPCTGGR